MRLLSDRVLSHDNPSNRQSRYDMNNDRTWQAAPVHNAKYFFASPTYNKWVKLTAADVHGLREVPGFEGKAAFTLIHIPQQLTSDCHRSKDLLPPQPSHPLRLPRCPHRRNPRHPQYKILHLDLRRQQQYLHRRQNRARRPCETRRRQHFKHRCPKLRHQYCSWLRQRNQD